MEYAPHDVSMYRTLSTAVIPRPIAWVGTRSTDGVDNLAPFSYYTVACVDPPVIAFSPLHFESRLKDTPRNILDTEAFTVNVVVEELVETMNATSASLDRTESEFDEVGIKSEESTVIDAPRVADAPISLECQLYDSVEFPTSTLVLGEVVRVHADASVLTDGKVDVQKVNTIGRLAGGYYIRTSDRFSLERPS